MPSTAEALCPKCSSPRVAGATECPSCGVIYSRYRALPSAHPAAVPAPAAAAPATAVAPARPATRAPYVSATQREALLRQLAEMFDAGFTVRQALTGPLVQVLPPRLSERLQAGAVADLPLSRILEDTQVFDRATLALVRAGELHGGLPDVLRRIADRIQARRTARNKLLGGLAYPGFLVLSGVVILPLPRIFSHSAADYVAHVVPSLLGLGVAVLAFLLYPRLPQDAAPRQALRNLGHALPFIRGILYQDALAQFTDVLGTSVQAGLPIRASLSLAFEATPHPVFVQGARQVARRLDDGESLAQALTPLRLPPMVASQIATGEQAGTLDKALPRVAADAGQRARRSTTRLLVAVGIVAFLLSAVAMARNAIGGYGHLLDQQEKMFQDMEKQ